MSKASDLNDALGQRIKQYEMLGQSMPIVPSLAPALVCRLDGSGFSKFTRGLARPYDAGFHNLMCEVTKELMHEANCSVGYTQSDEITIMMFNDSIQSQLYCGGRVFKILTKLATLASNTFNGLIPTYIPSKRGPVQFDCRIIPVPSREEAVSAFLWRELDASKNSISMAARSMFSHAELQNKNGSQMQEMMFLKHGVNWNNYPVSFRRGSYFRKETIVRAYTAEELEQLPPKHNARTNPNLQVTRSDIVPLVMPPLTKVANPVDVFFHAAAVQTKA